MGSPLYLLWLLLLLTVPVWPQAGISANYMVNQPEKVSGPEGGSVDIHFSFSYPGKLAKDPQMRIFWRRDNFHGKFIYNVSPPFTLEEYRGRLYLDWEKGLTSGSLRISGLRPQDTTEYFCRVCLITQKAGKQQWQAIRGTKLIVIPAARTTTSTTIPSPNATTTAGLRGSEGEETSASQSLSLGLVVGVALAGVVLIIAILGLIVFLRQKRRTGQQTKAQTPARKSFQDTEMKYENIGNKGQHTDPKLDHKEDGIVYASLVLSSPSSPGAPPSYPLQRSPQAETLYSALKA